MYLGIVVLGLYCQVHSSLAYDLHPSSCFLSQEMSTKMVLYKTLKRQKADSGNRPTQVTQWTHRIASWLSRLGNTSSFGIHHPHSSLSCDRLRSTGWGPIMPYFAKLVYIYNKNSV